MVEKFDGKVTAIDAKSPEIEQEAPETLLEPLRNPPPVPPHLPIKAALYWKDLAAILVARKTLTRADLGSLETLCILFNRIQMMTIVGVAIPAALANQLRLYHREFGLTPASRNRSTGRRRRKTQ